MASYFFNVRPETREASILLLEAGINLLEAGTNLIEADIQSGDITTQ